MKKILVSISGGASSMALLDKLIKEGQHEIAAAFINFKRDDRDEVLFGRIQRYCDRQQVELFTMEVNCNASFNSKVWRRFVANKFALDIQRTYKYTELYIGPSKNKDAERFITEENYPDYVHFYGYSKIETLDNYLLKAPQIDTWRDELVDYCKAKGVPFDEPRIIPGNHTSQELAYEEISKLTKDQIQLLINEKNRLNMENQEVIQKRRELYRVCVQDNIIDKHIFGKLLIEELRAVYSMYLASNGFPFSEMNEELFTKLTEFHLDTTEHRLELNRYFIWRRTDKGYQLYPNTAKGDRNSG